MSSSLLCSRRNNNKAGDGIGEPQIIISTPASAAAATMRKGPWTDEEDEQLVRFVRLFGERRWDFLAKVSGLRRTGKSCRLRWVNYLHPGLRRGRITEDEEIRIVELHAQWGSRWSRIARSLPGRTDNEIKNFWRTRTRKKALEERRAAAATAEPASSSSSVTTTSECRPGSSSSPTSGAVTTTSSSSGYSSSFLQEGRLGDGDDDAELEEASTPTAAPATKHEQQQQTQPQEYYYDDDGCSTMDQLWNEIAAADAAAMSYLVGDACWGGAAGHYYYGAVTEPPPASPPWEYCGSDFSLWRIDDQEYYKKMLDSS